jgi:hypothetical protein
MPYVQKTTVYLTDSLKARLERAAREAKTSEAAVIRDAIDSYTRGTVRPAPTLPLFERIGGADLADRVDDVLAEGFGRG